MKSIVTENGNDNDTFGLIPMVSPLDGCDADTNDKRRQYGFQSDGRRNEDGVKSWD